MTDTTSKPNARPGRRWARWLAWLAISLVVVVVVLYFVGTSSAFFKAVILPKVSEAVHADVTVSGAEISPFSRVVLRDLKVTPKGAEPLFAAENVTARYSLLSIIRGHILVDEVSVVSPTVTVTENADGTGNFSPLLTSESNKPKAPPKLVAPAKPSPPPALDIKSVVLKDATVRYVKNLAGGGRQALELSHVNVTVGNVKNGETGKLDFSALIAMDKNLPLPGSNTTVQARLNGAFTFNLAQDLKPETVTGNAAVNIGTATGDFAEFAALGAKLDCDTTPTEIKQVALTFTRAGAGLGELRVSGPLDLAKMEGKLKIDVSGLDRRVLNLVGAASGIDFGTTTIAASNELGLTEGGAVITATGRLNVAHLQVRRQGQTSPTLDLNCEYDVSVNRQQQSALLKTLKLVGLQNQRPLLQADLTSPMTVAWGNPANAVGDATLNLAVTGLDLADWKAFAGETAPSGTVTVKLNVLSQQAGRRLAVDFDSQVAQFTARVGKDQTAPIDVHLVARARGTDLKQFTLSEGRLELSQQNQSMLSVSTTGTFDRVTQAADVQVAVQAALSRVLTLLPPMGVTCSAGTLDFTGHATSQPQSQAVTGQLQLADFTGGYGDYHLGKFGTTIDIDVLMKGTHVEIRKAAGQLHEGPTAGGKFDVSGQYDLGAKSGQLTAKLVDFTENDLRPFLQPSLGDKKLVSVSFNTSASAGFNATGAASVKGDVHVANLVVQDPKNQIPATPLEVRLQVDASASNHAAAVQQCVLTLTPTKRAKNELRLTGSVDYAKSNAITGNFQLAADALDATAYYDLFAKTNQTSETAKPEEPKASSEPKTASTSSAPPKEPAAVTTPLHDFTFAVAIDRFYLREVAIANLQATAKIDGGHIWLKPCQLTLNGAPINANVDMDLGVPGYTYDIAFTADKVPLAPLVDSFSPTYSDKASGNLIANMQIKGAGITGRNLQKNLTGQATVTLTNASIQIVGKKAKAILQPISLALGLPNLLTSPLDFVNLDLQFANGNIQTRNFAARSAAFQVDSEGTIPIADVLTDSPLSQPVDVSLARQLANRFQLTGVQSDATYAKLPTFVHLAGTLASPTVKIDYPVVAVLTARGTVGVVSDRAGAVSGAADNILQGITGALTGQRQSSTNAPSKSSTPFNPFSIFK